MMRPSSDQKAVIRLTSLVYQVLETEVSLGLDKLRPPHVGAQPGRELHPGRGAAP